MASTLEMMNDKDYKGKDKALHFGVCLVLSMIHPCLAIGAALGKEYGDWKGYGHWCWWDILADSIGVICGSLVWWLVWK